MDGNRSLVQAELWYVHLPVVELLVCHLQEIVVLECLIRFLDCFMLIMVSPLVHGRSISLWTVRYGPPLDIPVSQNPN